MKQPRFDSGSVGRPFAVVVGGVGLVVVMALVSSSSVEGGGRSKLQTNNATKGRVAAAQKAYQSAFVGVRAGTVSAEQVYQWSCRIVSSQVESLRAKGKVDAKRLNKILKAHQSRMASLHNLIQARFRSGTVRQNARWAVTYYLKEADFWYSAGFHPAAK